MCEKRASLKKWLTYVGEIVFYGIIINLFFLIFRYYPLGAGELIKGMFSTHLVIDLRTGEDSFISIYMILYLLIPFLNKLVKCLNKKEHGILLLILLSVFSINHTFLYSNWEGVSWYVTVYLIGAWLRLYSFKCDNVKWGALFSITTILVSCISVVFWDLTYQYWGRDLHFWHGLSSANGIGSISIAVSIFILFKNLNIEENRIINKIASTTLGILLIHANSGTMRYFLWKDVLQNTVFYNSSFSVLVFHFVFSVIVIMTICVMIDLLRQKVFECLGNSLRRKMLRESKEYYLYE